IEEETVAPEPALVAALGYLLLEDGDGNPFRAAGPTGAGGISRLDLDDRRTPHVLIAQRAPGQRRTWSIAIDRGTPRSMQLDRAPGNHVLISDHEETTSARVTPNATGFDVEIGAKTYRLDYTAGETVRSAS